MPQNALVSRLGIENPVIQGPMSGGPSTPELVAAVSNAGGLGSLGAAYLTPGEISEAIRRIKSLTSRPFNVNLFAGGYEAKAGPDPKPMLDVLAEIHAELGLAAPVVPRLPPDPFPGQLEAVLDAGTPIFSFTFGVPSADAMGRVKARGLAIIGTATTVEEARALADAGVDAIAAQGAEAGGHRGTFAGTFEGSVIPTFDLVRGICGGVSVPVIACGGIMDGRDIATALRLGASAAALGTAFLASPESGAPPAHKRSILAAREDTTVITRAFSGRPARGLANAFIAKMAGRDDILLPYPLQNMLTRPMRSAAAKRGEAGFLSMWAGTGVARARALPAAELMARLIEEMNASEPPEKGESAGR
ncbi:MAG TPA: nitronate monooxygenase [Candidatus Acidoferrales bacterium]|nr:nitronate monooxygenase [Candidatus Acidoferrales bacterium]